MPVLKYRGKPIVIEAMQLTRDPKVREEIKKWIGEADLHDADKYDPVNLHIKNEHGIVIAEPGDWIIRGSRGEFYPCKDVTFREKYEAVSNART